LYFLPNIIRVVKSKRKKWAGHVAKMEKMQHAFILVCKSRGKRPLRRSKYSWKDNIKMHLTDIGCGGLV